MTHVRRRHAWPVCAVLLALAVPTSTRQTTFRSATDQVAVDVSVHAGLSPVRGLTPADFILEDKGVRQEIETLSTDALPVDVTLVMDVSGSVVGELSRFKENVRRIAGQLRGTDRFRLITFGTDVHSIESMKSASGSSLDLDRIRPEQKTSLNDGLFYALAWPAEFGRRHLVVAFTDGYDTASMLDEEQLTAIAARSDAVFHVVLSPELQGLGGIPARVLGAMPASRAAVIEAAASTGGASHKLSDAVKSFKEVFDDFRGSYVLRYTLHGVTRDGWHDVTVKLTRPGNFTIRARKGYFAG